jgi:hypothetical protein
VNVDANGGGDDFQTLVTLQVSNANANDVTLQQLLQNHQIVT